MQPRRADIDGDSSQDEVEEDPYSVVGSQELQQTGTDHFDLTPRQTSATALPTGSPLEQ